MENSYTKSTRTAVSKLSPNAERIIREMNSLVQTAKYWIDRESSGDDPMGDQPIYIPKAEISRLMSTALHLVRAYCGTASEYYENLNQLKRWFAGRDEHLTIPMERGLSQFIGIIKSLQDVIHGGIVSVEGGPTSDPEGNAKPDELSADKRNPWETAKRFNKWLLVGGSLGHGGQGEVQLVRHSVTFERGALKRMVGKRSLTEKGHERFLREMDAFRAVEHPFIVRILDTGMEPEPYLVTEVAPFGSLADNRTAFRGDAWRALRLTRSIALGLSAAHARRIIHRDVKPKNILIQTLDHPLVADFGIAHFADKDTLTSVDSHPGAFKFAPPEFEFDDEPTPAFDVFSLGAVLHCALIGNEPSRPYRVMEKLSQVGIDAASKKRFLLIDDLIDKMTKKVTRDRLQDMNEVVSAVDELTDRLFGRSQAGPNACACEIGTFHDIGAIHLGSGTEVNVAIGKTPHVPELRSFVSTYAPRLEICSSCGALRLRAAVMKHPFTG